MKLATINRWLRRVGLVLVVEAPTSPNDDEPVRLYFARASRFRWTT